MRHGTMIGRHRSTANLPKGVEGGESWLVGKAFSIPMETPRYGYTVRKPGKPFTPNPNEPNPPAPLPTTWPSTKLFREADGDRWYLYYDEGIKTFSRTVTGEDYTKWLNGFPASIRDSMAPKFTIPGGEGVTNALAVDVKTGGLVRFKSTVQDFNLYRPGYKHYSGGQVTAWPWAPYYKLSALGESRPHDVQHTYAWATVNNIGPVEGGEVDVDWTITLRRRGGSTFYQQHFPLQWLENGGDRFITQPLNSTHRVRLTFPRFENGWRYVGRRYQADYRSFDAHTPPPWNTNGTPVLLGSQNFTAEVVGAGSLWSTITGGPSYVRLSDSSGAYDLVRTPSTNTVMISMHNKGVVV